MAEKTVTLKQRQHKEYSRLKKLFPPGDKDKLKAVDGLIQRAAFMRVTLEDLESVVNDSGVLDHFVQGSNEYDREHPALKSYNSTIKNYVNTMRAICDALPDSSTAADELTEFLRAKRK